jgi:hypothetical protein
MYKGYRPFIEGCLAYHSERQGVFLFFSFFRFASTRTGISSLPVAMLVEVSLVGEISLRFAVFLPI